MRNSETYAQLSARYAELYPNEHEAEKLLHEARIIATEVAEDGPFEHREHAENYIATRVTPFLRLSIPEGVIIEANGEGLSVPQLDTLPMSEIPGIPSDFAESFALIVSGMRPHVATDAPVAGHLREFKVSVVDNEDNTHGISINAVIDPLTREQGRLHHNVSVIIMRSADVALNGAAHIATRRLNQVRRAQGLVATSSQHETATKLAATLYRIDAELVNPDPNPNKFKPLNDIRLLRYAGGLAAKMLKNAGNDTAERTKVIDIIDNAVTLADRTVLFSCDKPILIRPIIGEDIDPKNHWLPATIDENPQLGKVVGVVDCFYTPDSQRMPKHVPHIVVEAAVPEHKKRIYCFVPMPRISKFSF